MAVSCWLIALCVQAMDILFLNGFFIYRQDAGKDSQLATHSSKLLFYPLFSFSLVNCFFTYSLKKEPAEPSHSI
jgi:hypothetical protein